MDHLPLILDGTVLAKKGYSEISLSFKKKASNTLSGLNTGSLSAYVILLIRVNFLRLLSLFYNMVQFRLASRFPSSFCRMHETFMVLFLFSPKVP